MMDPNVYQHRMPTSWMQHPGITTRTFTLHQAEHNPAMHPIMMSSMFGIPPPWTRPVHPMTGLPLMSVRTSMGMHHGAPPIMYPWQRAPRAARRQPSLPERDTLWPFTTAQIQSWWEWQSDFDAADPDLEDGEKGSEKEDAEGETQPDLNGNRTPRARGDAHACPDWFDHMERIRMVRAMGPWLGYELSYPVFHGDRDFCTPPRCGRRFKSPGKERKSTF